MRSSGLPFTFLALLLAGCGGGAFVSAPLEQASFVERAIVETQTPVSVAAAVPDAEETRTLTGLDLYQQDIQPIWLSVTNAGDRVVRAAIRSIDEQYYSPMEVAWKFRNSFGKQGRADMERWFFENQLPRRIPAGETRSGFVFTHVAKGTKGFNFDVYTSEESYNFTFFVPIPGFSADYMDVDFANLYTRDEVVTVKADGLRDALTTLPCCSFNAAGDRAGDPLNVVIVGSPLAVRRSLLRAQWQETAANAPETTVARTHRHRRRPPDATFLKIRPDGGERKELRLWLSPIRVDEQHVWVGQVSYEMAGEFGFNTSKKYRTDPDIDDARGFLLQNFWYSQSLARLAYIDGIPPAPITAPAQNFSGSEYFTDGYRVVLFVSEDPVAMDEADVIRWEEVILE
jgi:LssY C-terminus